jgi:hypothetical protein
MTISSLHSFYMYLKFKWLNLSCHNLLVSSTCVSSKEQSYLAMNLLKVYKCDCWFTLTTMIMDLSHILDVVIESGVNSTLFPVPKVLYNKQRVDSHRYFEHVICS